MPCGGVDGPLRGKAREMDDSRETESSSAHVWAAESSADDHSTGRPVFTIGELSREFGVTLRALRFYENKGLISPQREGLSRLYSQGDRLSLRTAEQVSSVGIYQGEKVVGALTWE